MDNVKWYHVPLLALFWLVDTLPYKIKQWFAKGKS